VQDTAALQTRHFYCAGKPAYTCQRAARPWTSHYDDCGDSAVKSATFGESNRVSFFLFALLVTAANFAIGFGLAVYLGHGPDFSFDELRDLLARRRVR
jgi:hypothetical protein